MSYPPARYLVLVTRDPELMAVAPWIEGEVRHARDLPEVARLIHSSAGRAVLALGPDALAAASAEKRVPTYPFVVVHVDPTRLDRGLISELFPTPAIYELPAELDWLHHRLGRYKPPLRT